MVGEVNISSNSTSSERVYHLEPTWQALFMWAGLLILASAFSVLALVLFGQGLILQPSLTCLGMIGFFALLIVGSQCIQYVSKTRLITTRNGLEYHEPGYQAKARWEDIGQVAKVRFGLSTVEGVLLANRSQPSRRFVWPLRVMRTLDSIPLTPFIGNWRQMDVGRQLRAASTLEDPLLSNSVYDSAAQSSRSIRENRVQKIEATQAVIQRIFIVALVVLMLAALVWGVLDGLSR